MTDKIKNIFNIIFFYIVWYGSVLGVKYSLSYNIYSLLFIGPSLTILFLIVHLINIENLKKGLIQILSCTLIGTIIEFIHIVSGAVSFNGYLYNGSITIFPPIWIICLWAGFATTLNQSMNWIKGKWALIALLGAVLGPICYYAALKLSILEINLYYIKSIGIISLSWGILIPIMFYINKQIYKNL